MTEKLEELQKRFFKISWDIKENREGMSDELFNEMNANLLTEYMREYDKLNGTIGLQADEQIAELKRKRKKIEAEIKIQDQTLDEEIKIKRRGTVPDTVRRWLFWRKPNRAMELAIEMAQAQISEYLSEREDEVELQAIKLGAVPAKMSDRVYGVLTDSLPIPRNKKKQRKREELIEELSQTLCRSIMLNINSAMTIGELDKEQEKATKAEENEEIPTKQGVESGGTDKCGSDTPEPADADTL